MDNLIKIILVDDHPLMRLGVKSSLSAYKDELNVVAEASTADELLEIIHRYKVDVILLDIQMPGMSCEEAVRILKTNYSDVKIIILSSSTDKEVLYKLVELGIDGFVPKTSNIEIIKSAIKEVNSGTRYYGADILKIIKEFEQSVTSATSITSALTEREKEVMQMCCEGLCSKEIASKLNISHRTVEMHKANIFKKLDINSTVELLKWAVEHGLVAL